MSFIDNYTYFLKPDNVSENVSLSISDKTQLIINNMF